MRQKITQTDSSGLYIHLPWCVRKCPYCDFNSYERGPALPERDYIDALRRDLETERSSIGTRTVASIYIGGGTPSLFSVAGIGELLDSVSSAVTLAHDVEITLEANPGAIEAHRFNGYRSAGVTRVSIGVQSLRDPQLQVLGRIHSAAEAVSAVRAALAAGFDSVNVDLMYGLPGDGLAEGLCDLQAAIALGSQHLSWYQLTMEPSTVWGRRPPAGLPADEAVIELEEQGRSLLAAAGFERYEISAYAKDGYRCRHNLHYWRFGDYIGIGAGAHSKLRLGAGPGHMRRSKLRNPRSYMRAAGTGDCIDSTELIGERSPIALEYLMNALRLTGGVTAQEFESQTGITVAEIDSELHDLRRQGLLRNESDKICTSEDGLRHLNTVLRHFC